MLCLLSNLTWFAALISSLLSCSLQTYIKESLFWNYLSWIYTPFLLISVHPVQFECLLSQFFKFQQMQTVGRQLQKKRPWREECRGNQKGWLQNVCRPFWNQPVQWQGRNDASEAICLLLLSGDVDKEVSLSLSFLSGSEDRWWIYNALSHSGVYFFHWRSTENGPNGMLSPHYSPFPTHHLSLTREDRGTKDVCRQMTCHYHHHCDVKMRLT